MGPWTKSLVMSLSMSSLSPQCRSRLMCRFLVRPDDHTRCAQVPGTWTLQMHLHKHTHARGTRYPGTYLPSRYHGSPTVGLASLGFVNIYGRTLPVRAKCHCPPCCVFLGMEHTHNPTVWSGSPNTPDSSSGYEYLSTAVCIPEFPGTLVRRTRVCSNLQAWEPLHTAFFIWFARGSSYAQMHTGSSGEEGDAHCHMHVDISIFLFSSFYHVTYRCHYHYCYEHINIINLQLVGFLIPRNHIFLALRAFLIIILILSTMLRRGNNFLSF